VPVAACCQSWTRASSVTPRLASTLESTRGRGLDRDAVTLDSGRVDTGAVYYDTDGEGNGAGKQYIMMLVSSDVP
jgi:hypothetical protein